MEVALSKLAALREGNPYYSKNPSLPLRVLDLGTGSGALLLSLLHQAQIRVTNYLPHTTPLPRMYLIPSHMVYLIIYSSLLSCPLLSCSLPSHALSHLIPSPLSCSSSHILPFTLCYRNHTTWITTELLSKRPSRGKFERLGTSGGGGGRPRSICSLRGQQQRSTG